MSSLSACQSTREHDIFSKEITPLIRAGGISVIIISTIFLGALPNFTFSQCEIQNGLKLTASDAGFDERFGVSVALSENTAVVGAWLDRCEFGSECGAAYVFTFNGTNWLLEQKLAADDREAEAYFGYRVDILSDRIVVGAPGHDCLLGFDCGAAYVFKRTGNSWTQESKLISANLEPFTLLGGSVSLSGESIAVGASGAACESGTECGAVHMFRLNGTVWVEEQRIIPTDEMPTQFFGHAVALDGEILAVGKPYDNCYAGSRCGMVVVYHFNGHQWIEIERITPSEPVAHGRFGSSVSIDGDVIGIGLFRDGCDSNSDCALGYMYRKSGDSWIEEQKLTSLDAMPFSMFGSSINVRGNVASVGSYNVPCSAGINCGSAHAFRFNGSRWIEQVRMTALDAAAGDSFGISTAIADGFILVGAPLADCPLSANCGAAYIFSLAACMAMPLVQYCDTDSDSDSFPDYCDNCYLTPNPEQMDTDNDGIGDVCDPCPLDNPDDPDGDSVCSSDEACPDDPLKQQPGACGCGIADSDSDGDTVADCNDLCPEVDDRIYAPQCAGAIPAASQWGLLVLALSLIVIAKLRMTDPIKSSGRNSN